MSVWRHSGGDGRGRNAVTSGCLLALLPVALLGAANQSEPTAERVVARYLEARGGAEAWRRLEALEIRGSCSTFSQRGDCRLIRKRGDLYRFDFMLLGSPAVRARDARGPWALHKLLKPEPGRLTAEAYAPQFEREALFEPPLLDHAAKGIAVELLGPGDLDGRPTVDLKLVFGDGTEEIWRLDAETSLEVAVDSRVMDFTQGAEPMAQRAFFEDFRRVGDVVLPYRMDLEFGARLEEMIVREVVVDPELDEADFALPATPQR